MEENHRIIALQEDLYNKGILTATELLKPVEIPDLEPYDYYQKRSKLFDLIKQAFPEYFSDVTKAKSFQNSSLISGDSLELKIEQTLHEKGSQKIKYEGKILLPKKRSGKIKITDTTLSLDLGWKLPSEWQAGNYYLETTHSLGSERGLTCHDHKMTCSVSSEYSIQIKSPNKLQEALELSILALIADEKMASFEPRPETSTRFDFHSYRPTLWNFTNPTQDRLSQLTEEILALKRKVFDCSKHSAEFYALATNLAASLQLLEVYCKQYQANLPKKDEVEERFKECTTKLAEQEMKLDEMDQETLFSDDPSFSERMRDSIAHGINQEKVDSFIFVPGRSIGDAWGIYHSQNQILKSSRFIYEAVSAQLKEYDQAMDRFREKAKLDLPTLKDVLERKEI